MDTSWLISHKRCCADLQQLGGSLTRIKGSNFDCVNGPFCSSLTAAPAALPWLFALQTSGQLWTRSNLSQPKFESQSLFIESATTIGHQQHHLTVAWKSNSSDCETAELNVCRSALSRPLLPPSSMGCGGPCGPGPGGGGGGVWWGWGTTAPPWPNCRCGVGGGCGVCRADATRLKLRLTLRSTRKGRTGKRRLRPGLASGVVIAQ